MAASLRPLFTENFAANLDSIRLFLEPEGRLAFRRLINRLFQDIVPTLCRFPQSGRLFLAHAVQSMEAQALVDRLKALLKADDDMREFVVDDYLILYLVRQNRVIFLAIKHHRQLSFDLRRLWI
ncbi:MAG: type II toxin-antitoxin system RelE/ParE family toxin [Deltaproteobacteria bacterium]|nr:type II toxin-antitoxin system RelE/ParE family toxin [Deltaproteobacteria bacterium]